MSTSPALVNRVSGISAMPKPPPCRSREGAARAPSPPEYSAPALRPRELTYTFSRHIHWHRHEAAANGRLAAVHQVPAEVDSLRERIVKGLTAGLEDFPVTAAEAHRAGCAPLGCRTSPSESVARCCSCSPSQSNRVSRPGFRSAPRDEGLVRRSGRQDPVRRQRAIGVAGRVRRHRWDPRAMQDNADQVQRVCG